MVFGCFGDNKIGIEKAHIIITTNSMRNNPSMQYSVRIVPQFHGWHGVVLKEHGANVHLVFSRVSVTDRISLAVPIIPISCPQHSFRVVTFGLVIWQVWQLIILLVSLISVHFVSYRNEGNKSWPKVSIFSHYLPTHKCLLKRCPFAHVFTFCIHFQTHLLFRHLASALCSLNHAATMPWSRMLRSRFPNMSHWHFCKNTSAER